VTEGGSLQSRTGTSSGEAQSFCVALPPGRSDEALLQADALGGDISGWSWVYGPRAYTPSVFVWRS